MNERWDWEATRDRARSLRAEATFAERLLWSRLRGRRGARTGFRRQAPIGGYIVDFCCRRARLVVEIDGRSHDSERAQRSDGARDRYLAGRGLLVLRFSNEEVIGALDAVVRRIGEVVVQRVDG